jgi:hypothetical protein
VQGMTLACIRVDVIAIRWRSPTMPSQALEMGCAIASRHLGEHKGPKEGCAAIVSS